MDNSLLDGFSLQDVRVDPLSGRVTRRDGSAHLASRAVEVLLCLAKKPRRLVAREEILAAVWGEGNGSAEALSHVIGDIRHALGDHAEQPRFIQTVPRRGYRLLPEPRLAHAASETPAASAAASPLWKALVRHGVVQAGIAYLIVGWLLIQVADATFDNLGLPQWAVPFVTFTVVGGFPLVMLLAWFLEMAGGRMVRDRGQQRGGWLQGLERNYLAVIAAYGLAAAGAGVYQSLAGFSVPANAAMPDAPAESAAELIPVVENSIAVLKMLNIDGSERTEAFSAGLSEDVLDRLARLPGLRVSSRGDAWSLPPNSASNVVRRRLRVAYFLEGSVRIVGDQLRVVAQLIDSKDGFHVISRSFNKDLQDHLSVQKEITGLIVANLRVALPDDTPEFSALGVEDAGVDAYLLYHRGRELLGRPATAETIRQSRGYFEQALAIDSGFAAAHAGVCGTYVAQYELEHDADSVTAAEAACAAALEASAQLPVVHNAVGRLHLVTGHLAEAGAAFQSALRLNGQDAVAMKGLAAVYQRQQRIPEAEALLTRAIELQPGNWSSINVYGNFLFGVGRYADAAEQYRRVVYLDPDNFVAMGNLGSVQLMAGDFAGARQSIERSLDIEANEAIYSNLGIVYYYLGEFDKSADIQRKVVALSPDSHAAWLNLGDALYFSGDETGAMQAFERSAELSRRQLAVNPRNAEALYLLAWAEAMRGAEADAARLIERALSVAPNDPYSHYYDALIHVRQGELELATGSIVAAAGLGYPRSMLAAEPYLRRLRSVAAFTDLLDSQARAN